MTPQIPIPLAELAKSLTQPQIAALAGVTERTVRRWLAGESPVPVHAEMLLSAALRPQERDGNFTFIDLFAGIGGTRLGFEAAGGRCVFTSEWNAFAQSTYLHNFGIGEGHHLAGDITMVDAAEVPDHDVLVAGFPCQPFSIAGVSKKNALGRPHGFLDETQGTLFFDVARLIAAKRPAAFLLENVKNLASHDQGRTLRTMLRVLQEELGYHVQYRVIDAASWVPQMRKRIFIVGFRDRNDFDFDALDVPAGRRRMGEILHRWDEQDLDGGRFWDAPNGRVHERYTLTPKLWAYLQGYAAKHRSAGNGFGFGLVGPDDVARTLSARYYKDGSEILVSQGEGATPRRLTPRECARLMGFPEDFVIPVSDTQAYKQFGNSVVVPVAAEVARLMAPLLQAAEGRAA